MPGPPPKPPSQRRRRNVAPQTVKLPLTGRDGPVPNWPLSEPSEGEFNVWSEVWATPQAVQWAKLGWTRTVARYVRLLLLAERPDADTKDAAEVRQMEDRLGLTPMSMLRLRWEIEVPAANEEPAGVANLDDYRELYG